MSQVLGFSTAVAVIAWYLATYSHFSFGSSNSPADIIQETCIFQRQSDRALTFPNAAPVPTLQVQGNDEFLDQVVREGTPVVIKGSRVTAWPAIAKKEWSNVSFWELHLPFIVAHQSRKATARMHSQVQPMGAVDGLRWSRPWTEHNVAFSDFVSMRTRSYFLTPLSSLPPPLSQGVLDTSFLHLAFRRLLETNVWLGLSNVVTPLHYDVTHNSYVQVAGRKRFILMRPILYKSLYVFPRIHPSTRMSQVDLEAVRYDDFPKFNETFIPDSVFEVVLEKGDVLYIPPYWFHHVATVGGPFELSASVSVCYESEIIRIREEMLRHAIPIEEQWAFNKRASCLFEFIYYGLFQGNRERAVSVISSLISSRYATLHTDLEVEGFREVQSRAAVDFQFHYHQQSPQLRFDLKRSGSKVSNMLYEIKLLPEVRELEMMNYIEDAANYVIGNPMYVHPFLQAVVDIMATPESEEV